MTALPLRNQALSSRHNEKGEVEITIKRRNDWVGKLFAAIFFVPEERRVVLESIGSDVWDLCDGQHTVSQIADALAEKHKLSRREAEVALVEFLRRLGKRRLIVLAIQEDNSSYKGKKID